VTDIHGFLSFLWSPDGRYIAYRSLDQTGLSVLQLIDANTGESLMSSDVEGVVSFFWSPDSRKIAYLTLEEGRERDAFANPQFVSLDLIQNNSPTNLSWSILEIETGGNLSYSAFTPSSEMVYLLSYFDQFAPSHRLWSPDSRYLLYSGIENDRTFVIALDTETGLVTNLFEGLFAVWSFR
jgi:TolB protein